MLRSICDRPSTRERIHRVLQAWRLSGHGWAPTPALAAGAASSALGACDPEGGETAELLDGLQQTETFLAGALELVREARSRVKACTNTVRLQWRMELED